MTHSPSALPEPGACSRSTPHEQTFNTNAVPSNDWRNVNGSWHRLQTLRFEGLKLALVDGLGK